MIIVKTGGMRGKLIYTPPEVFLSTTNAYSNKADVFAFGMMLYEMINNGVVWGNENEHTIRNKIAKGERPAFANNCNKIFRDLIEKCWEQDENKRFNMEEVLQYLDGNSQKFNIDNNLLKDIDSKQQELIENTVKLLSLNGIAEDGEEKEESKGKKRVTALSTSATTIEMMEKDDNLVRELKEMMMMILSKQEMMALHQLKQDSKLEEIKSTQEYQGEVMKVTIMR